MFNEWKHRRKLRREIDLLNEQQAILRADSGNAVKRLKLSVRINSAQRELEALETNRLVRKARRLGIEIPHTGGWWWDDLDEVGDPNDVTLYLTDIGKASVSRLIREDRRKSIEWWVKIITPIIGALISLLGLIVALVSVSRK